VKHKRIALVLLALVSLVMPVIETAITGHTEPFGAFAMIEVGLSLPLLFWWYHVDKEQHGYRAGPLMNGAILVAAIVAFPIYFVRSRGWKRGSIATGIALAYAAATFGLGELGEMLGRAIA
jgi:hypothetical protein